VSEIHPKISPDGISVASGAIISPLLDTLASKGTLTIPEVREILTVDLTKTTAHRRTQAGFEASQMISESFATVPRAIRATVLSTAGTGAFLRCHTCPKLDRLAVPRIDLQRLAEHICQNWCSINRRWPVQLAWSSPGMPRVHIAPPAPSCPGLCKLTCAERHDCGTREGRQLSRVAVCA